MPHPFCDLEVQLAGIVMMRFDHYVSSNCLIGVHRSDNEMHFSVVSGAVFPLAYLKQGGPPCLNLEHYRKWVEFEAII